MSISNLLVEHTFLKYLYNCVDFYKHVRIIWVIYFVHEDINMLICMDLTKHYFCLEIQLQTKKKTESKHAMLKPSPTITAIAVLKNLIFQLIHNNVHSKKMFKILKEHIALELCFRYRNILSQYNSY